MNSTAWFFHKKTLHSLITTRFGSPQGADTLFVFWRTTMMMHRHQSASFWWTEICIIEGSLDVIYSLQQCNTAFLDDGLLSWIFSYLIIGPHSPNTWDAANIDLHLHSTQTQLVRHYDSCFLKNLQYKIHEVIDCLSQRKIQ